MLTVYNSQTTREFWDVYGRGMISLKTFTHILVCYIWRASHSGFRKPASDWSYAASAHRPVSCIQSPPQVRESALQFSAFRWQFWVGWGTIMSKLYGLTYRRGTWGVCGSNFFFRPSKGKNIRYACPSSAGNGTGGAIFSSCRGTVFSKSIKCSVFSRKLAHPQLCIITHKLR